MVSKGFLNKRLGIKKDNLKDLIFQLKKVINKTPQNNKSNQEIIEQGLKELGWTDCEIKEFSNLQSRDLLFKKHNPNQQTSPSTRKPNITPKIFEGGSPGLGKGKS